MFHHHTNLLSHIAATAITVMLLASTVACNNRVDKHDTNQEDTTYILADQDSALIDSLSNNGEAIDSTLAMPANPDSATTASNTSSPYTHEVIYSLDSNKIYTSPNNVMTSSNTSGGKIVYLTFDDGPSPNTQKVLRILKEYNVHATFFVTGNHKNCARYISQAYQEGHTIAAHTNTHNFNIYTSFNTFFDDLSKVQEVIKEHTGHYTHIIRFPGGSSNTAFAKYNDDPLFMIKLAREVQKRGYQYVDWNVSSMDASGQHIPTDKIIAASCNTRKSNVCLLMHDTYGKETTVEALPAIIEYYKSHGYTFGMITDPSYTCHHGEEMCLALAAKRFKQKGYTYDSNTKSFTRHIASNTLHDTLPPAHP